MRTTIRLDDNLLREAKAHAAATGRTLTAVIEDALRETFRRRRQRRSGRRVKLKTVGGSGTQPGVDLDDSRALLDLMDRA
ncbi:MAG: type II toxin-antitoxin system VapB family antitoxin [Geminicoccales bacterium]